MLLYQDATEASRRRTSFLVALIAHAVFLAILTFFFKWSPPNPPLSGGGPEVNIGMGDEGFGDIQSLAPPNDSPNPDGDAGTPEQQDAQQENVTPVREETPDEVASANTQEEESPVEVPKAEPKVEPKPEPKKPEPKAEPKTEPKVEPKTEPRREAPKPSIPAPPSYPGTKPGGGGTGAASGVAGNNNGNKPGTVGDKGDPRGTINGQGLYPGTGGNGTGAALDLAGWNWDSKPDKADPFDEEGKIVFEIKVDEEGNLVSVRPVEKTVSPKVVQFYQTQIENLTFSKKRDNADPAPISSGRITIVIRSR